MARMARKVVITMAALKGGAGKSTLAQAIACEWQRRGLDVLIVDVDENQRTTHKWDGRKQSGGPSVIAKNAGNLDVNFASITRPYDVVIIDTPGKLGDPMVAMGLANLVVMPTGPNQTDIEAMDETFTEARRVRSLKPSVDACILITKKRTGTISGRLAHKAFEDQPFDVLETELDYREDYDKANKAGLGPTTLAPEGEAAAEVGKLCDELERRLKMNSARPRPRARKGHLRAV